MPHLKSLVERHEDDPFAIIGINTNDSEQDFRKGVEDFGVTWDCVYQGKELAIVKQYKVRAFPTKYLLDHTGRIRFINSSGSALDQAVAELVKEARAAREE